MSKMNKKTSIPKKIETVFDLLYLALIPVLGLRLFALPEMEQKLWGVMALVLICGDAFHLVPRILSANTENQERYVKALGRGKQITSITMTLFYLLLWHIGLQIFQMSLPAATAFVYAVAVVRIGLCLFPQNGWTNQKPDYAWGIWRNIPFILEGAAVAALFAVCGADVPGVKLMWLAIILSFGFYLPVVLWADKNPKIGMLMLPKTCVYVWMVCMGFFIR